MHAGRRCWSPLLRCCGRQIGSRLIPDPTPYMMEEEEALRRERLARGKQLELEDPREGTAALGLGRSSRRCAAPSRPLLRFGLLAIPTNGAVNAHHSSIHQSIPIYKCI